MRRSEQMSTGEMAGWGVLGFITGLVAGSALAAWVGGMSPNRLSRAVRRRRMAAPERPRTAAATVTAAMEALASEPSLAGLTLDALALRQRAVELRGWVRNRNQRALAARCVREVAGIDTVVNRILVRGEDDRPRDLPAQPANETA